MRGTGSVGTIVLLRRTSDSMKRLGQKKPAGRSGGLDGKNGVIISDAGSFLRERKEFSGRSKAKRGDCWPTQAGKCMLYCILAKSSEGRGNSHTQKWDRNSCADTELLRFLWIITDTYIEC